jgi:hypothetical protein
MALRVLVLAFLVTAARAELSSEEWQKLHREALELNGKEGEADRKGACIDALAAEDGARTAAELAGMAAAAFDKHAKLEHKLERAEADYSRIHKRLRARLGKKARRSEFEKDPKWRRAREEVDQLTDYVRTEEMVLQWVGQAFSGMRSPEAVAVMVDKSDRTVAAARQSDRVRNGILEALWSQPPEKVVDDVLSFASDRKLPEARARVLDWIGKRKVAKGYAVAVECLEAKETSVARAAVAALVGLGDPRCVPELIKTLRGTTGLLAEEIEVALHEFTGQKFFGQGSGTMYAGWWRAEGETWLRSGGHAPTADGEHPESKAGGAEFYGIATRSNRIVFVLDRSGSMAEPVPHPKGPVTGAKAADRVPGNTKLEVAQNQLARTIRSLRPDVKFAVVFYSHDVHVWQDPPTLLPATATNKKRAIEWVKRLKPVGSTMIFDALRMAHRYAAVGDGSGATDPKGADTIFLLSDGAPSDPSGSALLTGPALEKEVKDFLEANLSYRCVVHTIGVGPTHNRALMQRLAKETGGTYKAVGMK